MAALVCDICGGKLVMGSGGIAVCDSCGMEHSPDRMKEKVQEIKGTVQVDNSHMIDSWMKMGKSASEAGNHKEAYDYFTKVVELDPQNWRAIFEKGKAGAWQSTLANLRTAEIYQGITMALEIVNSLDMPCDEVIGIKNEFAVALFNINNAITDLMEQNLFELDDKYFDSHWDQMWNTRQRHITNVSQLEDALTLIVDLEDDLSKSNVIEFKNIKKAYEDKVVISDFNLSIEKGEFVTIIGSSGCGKTTILKMINGLIESTSGDIFIDGETIKNKNLIELRRNIGYAIQGSVLFPHMTVKQNISYVPNLLNKKDKKKTEDAVYKWMKIVGLDEELK